MNELVEDIYIAYGRTWQVVNSEEYHVIVLPCYHLTTSYTINSSGTSVISL